MGYVGFDKGGIVLYFNGVVSFNLYVLIGSEGVWCIDWILRMFD